MSLAFVLYNFLNNIFYLAKSEIGLQTKVKIFAKYFMMTLAFPIAKILNVKKISFSGLQIKAFTYDSIHQLFGEIFVKGEYFFRSRAPNPTIIDAGANIGVGILYFKFLYPKSKITAYEPDPQTFKLLATNIKSNNLTDVHLTNAAVANMEGQIDFYTDKPGSVSASAMRTDLKKRMKVKSITLPEVIKRLKKVDLLKVDIEGYEYLVFKDLASKNSLKFVREIIVEYHHNLTNANGTLDEFLALLRQAGYKYQIDGTSMPLYKKNFYQAVLIYAYK